MSDAPAPLRIRVQHSARDPDALRFVLDAPVQPGAAAARFDAPDEGAPLSGALFTVAGVRRIEVDGATIHIRKDADASWDTMKAPLAAAIRAALAEAVQPLGEPQDAEGAARDAEMLAMVHALLDSRVNPSIAAHGGRIAAEGVTDGTLYLRMSGGCQGCAASQLTLRGGVERILRAALPDLKGIVDVTDHGAGAAPFYRGGTGPDTGSPLAEGDMRGGPARPTSAGEASPGADTSLPARVRRHLEALPSSAPTISYGALARALGFLLPGSIRKVTRALEETMREDQVAGRPFIAARAVSRGSDGLPGKGFFDLACALSRGPREGETERAFHAREIEAGSTRGR